MVATFLPLVFYGLLEQPDGMSLNNLGLLNWLVPEVPNESYEINIFATDIDNKALKTAVEGKYDYDRIKNIKFEFLNKYFNIKDNLYTLKSEIKKMVQFSFFNLLDKKHFVPPESIFGDFDIVLCRNVLIYFDHNHQEIIFNKLFKSLNSNGYLILGEAEAPIEKFAKKFKKENECCKIYRKIS